MVIQRWQSVWLLIAAIFMVLYMFMPMFIVETPQAALLEAAPTYIFPIEMIPYFIVCGLVALLLFIDIFLYRNTSLQKSVAVIAFFITIGLNIACWAVYWGWGPFDEPLDWMVSVFMQYGTMIFSLLAWYGIRRDEKLLRDSDRLR